MTVAHPQTSTATLRIAYVYRHFNRNGSIESLYLRHAERLARDAAVTLFCSHVERAPTRAPLAFCNVEPFVHSRGRMGYAVECASFAARATQALAAARDRFDLVHVEGCNALCADVVTVHAVRRAEVEHYRTHVAPSRGRLRHAAGLLASPQSLVVMGIERRLLRTERPYCICPSKRVRDDLVTRHDVPAERIAVIPYGIDVNSYAPDAEARLRLRAARGVEAAELVLLVVATEFARKGVDLAIEALARSSISAQLWIVGGDDPSRYRRLAARAGVGGAVHFVGRVPPEQLAAWYAAADVLLAPSRQDSWNLPVVEAVASGLVVIVSEDSGSAEAISDGENGFVVAGPDIAGRIARTLERVAVPEHRLAMGERARASAGEYDAETVYARVRGVYERARPRVAS